MHAWLATRGPYGTIVYILPCQGARARRLQSAHPSCVVTFDGGTQAVLDGACRTGLPPLSYTPVHLFQVRWGFFKVPTRDCVGGTAQWRGTTSGRTRAHPAARRERHLAAWEPRSCTHFAGSPVQRLPITCQCRRQGRIQQAGSGVRDGWAGGHCTFAPGTTPLHAPDRPLCRPGVGNRHSPRHLAPRRLAPLPLPDGGTACSGRTHQVSARLLINPRAFSFAFGKSSRSSKLKRQGPCRTRRPFSA